MFHYQTVLEGLNFGGNVKFDGFEAEISILKAYKPKCRPTTRLEPLWSKR